MTTTNDIDARCPTCDSPAPNLHPAVQSEGEVQPCADPFHAPSETGKLRAELADVRAKYQDALWTASQHAAKVAELTADVDRLRQERSDAATAYLEDVTDLTAELAKTRDALTEANRQRTVAEATTDALKRDNAGYAAQVEQMRAVVEAAKEWGEHYGTTGDKYHAAAVGLIEALKKLPNDQEPCDICSGYGCPDCREDEPIDPLGAGWTQGDNFHADRAEVAS